MKRWLWVLAVLALIVVGWYYFVNHAFIKDAISQPSGTNQDATASNAIESPNMAWQTVERPQDGIKVEMPAGAKDIEAPAYNTNGTSEPVAMLSSSPDAKTEFAMGWENDPPVARANRHDPQRTLKAAREGMLARTQTSLIQQSELSVGGFPALDLTARNAAGGILDARLIYADGHLYSMFVVFPTVGARRQKDVDRFYQSFTPVPMTAKATRS